MPQPYKNKNKVGWTENRKHIGTKRLHQGDGSRHGLIVSVGTYVPRNHNWTSAAAPSGAAILECLNFGPKVSVRTSTLTLSLPVYHQ